jgi:phage repressor protein C with HTH and peptisase S24 domain
MLQQTVAARVSPPPPKFIHPDGLPDMYALTGVGTCMQPLIQDGACCVFDKREEPQPGDIVGVMFTREAAVRRGQPGVIKRLVMPPPPAGFDGLFIVEQINPPRSYTLPTADVIALHKFVGIAERHGKGTAHFRLPKKEAV